jgi:flagellin-like protein
MNWKKGVSPLIASVLLIAIVVGLGAILYQVMRGYADDVGDSKDAQKEAFSCLGDVVLQWAEDEDGVPRITDDSDKLSVTVKNMGRANVSVELSAAGATFSSIPTADIAPGGVETLSGDYTGDPLTAITVIPTITVSGEPVVCGGSTLDYSGAILTGNQP